MSLAALQGGCSVTNALDDPKLLKNLVSQAKSSHSNLGRSLDTSLSYRKIGGGCVEPSAMSVNRQEKQRQLDMQKKQQEAWHLASRMLFGEAANAPPSASWRAASPNAVPPPQPHQHPKNAQRSLAGSRVTRSAPSGATASTPHNYTRSLVVPELATMAPSFTKAADDGVADLGGTRLSGAGHTSRIAVIPTEQTIACLADEDELISSFRPYQHDARAAARQAAMREISAPHPDLLRQLEPTLNAVAPNRLVDTGAIPELLLARQNQPYQQDGEVVDAGGLDAEEPAALEGDADAQAQRDGLREGTYPFLAVGRDRGARQLPGHRQPGVGQYQVRYSVIEARVTGGYIQPHRLSTRPGDSALQTTAETQETSGERPPSATLDNGPASFGSTLVGGNGLAGAEAAGDDDQTTYPPGYQPGQNIKGSSMFLSKTDRKIVQGTAAPDVSYWPYPDVRSTTRRVPEPVRMDGPINRRRREPAVSGVPSAVYDVAGGVASGLHNTVSMSRSPGREAHWYGKTDQHTQASTAFGDADSALRATRPHERTATLPPRISEDEDRQKRSAGAGVGADTSVSIERDLNYPRDLIGGPDRLAHVRSFDKIIDRAHRDRVAAGVNAHAGARDTHLQYEPETTQVDKRQPTAIIHAQAPGHDDPIGTREVGDLGEIPNLKWTRPNSARGAQFGAGSKRPDHLLTMHDLTYDTEPGHRLIGPRTGGDPMIGSVVSRQKRDKVFSAVGSGPQSGAVYNGDPLASKAKLVPDFAHQITKETQFAGHRVPSERYERNNPKAPGPGFYDVSYVQVDKHNAVATIQ